MGQVDFSPVWATNPAAGTALLEVGFNPTGGQKASPALWYYSAGAWSNRTVGSNSAVLVNGTIQCSAYDPNVQAYVDVGATFPTNGTSHFRTFYYSAGAWAEESSSVGAPWLTNAGTNPACVLSWDPAVAALVLGIVANYPKPDKPAGFGAGFQTWILGGGHSVWTNITSTAGYPNDYSPAMAYDPATGELILFGEQGSTNAYSTWTLESTLVWTNRTIESTAFYPPLGFDGGCGDVLSTFAHGILLLYGGDSCPFTTWNGHEDVWTWVNDSWVSETLNGSLPDQVGSPELAGPIGPTQMLLWAGSANASSNFLFNYTSIWTCQGWICGATNPAGAPPVITPIVCSSVNVSWNPPAPPAGENITASWVWIYAEPSGSLVQVLQLTGYPNSTVVAGLQCGSTYLFKIELFFSAGAPTFGSGSLFTTASLFGTASCAAPVPTWPYVAIGLLGLLVVVILVAWAYSEESRRHRRRKGS